MTHPLYFSSYLTTFSIAYAVYCVQWQCAFVNTCVFATSLLYWSDPGTQWKRRVDQVITVTSGSWYMSRAAHLPKPNLLPFYILSTTAVYFYLLARRVHHVGISTRLHQMLHVFGNLAVGYYLTFI